MLFLIPARGGSKGIPHKNIKILAGKPLLQYSIDVARKLTTDDNICVSTDDPEIIAIAESVGLKVPFMRPVELASDTATSSDVIVHAIKYYESHGRKYDVVVLLQPTSPLRTVNHIKDAVALYSAEIDMVASVKECECISTICCENVNGYIEMVFNKKMKRRQDIETYYQFNGAIYVINTQSVLQKGISNFMKIKKYVMPAIYSADIDSMLDWHCVEALIVNNEVKIW